MTVSALALAAPDSAGGAFELTSPVPASRYSNGFGGAANHMGLDFIAEEGADVLAAAPGVVAQVRPLTPDAPSPYGNYLVLDHGDGAATLYGHCSALLVKEGARVAAGDIIARVGQTGQATGPNLHFELRRGGEPLDPTEYFIP